MLVFRVGPHEVVHERYGKYHKRLGTMKCHASDEHPDVQRRIVGNQTSNTGKYPGTDDSKAESGCQKAQTSKSQKNGNLRTPLDECITSVGIRILNTPAGVCLLINSTHEIHKSKYIVF